MMNALAKWQPYTPLDTDENAMGALMGCADPAAIHCTGCDVCWPKTRERQTSADDPRIFPLEAFGTPKSPSQFHRANQWFWGFTPIL